MPKTAVSSAKTDASMNMSPAFCKASRNTKQRALVLQAVQALHNHPTSANVFDEVRKTNPTISRATVYRNLGVLAEQGQILHIEVAGGADRYDFRLDKHAHAICSKCGAVYDVELAGTHPVLDEVANAHGFQVQGFSLTFSGLCPKCQ